jgi:hypothetical protein
LPTGIGLPVTLLAKTGRGAGAAPGLGAVVCGLATLLVPGVVVDGREALAPPVVVVIAGRDVVIGPFAVGVVRGVDVVIGVLRDTGDDVLGVPEDCGAGLDCWVDCCVCLA